MPMILSAKASPSARSTRWAPSTRRKVSSAGTSDILLGVLTPLTLGSLYAAFRKNGGSPETFKGRIGEFRRDRDNARDEATEQFSTTDPVSNGDEQLFAARTVEGRDAPLVGFGSFSKGLKHDDFGIPEQAAFQSLLTAVEIGLQSTDKVVNRDAFQNIILGGGKKLLANPLAAYSTQLIGNDSNGTRMAPAPTFGSRNTAVDMVERYWMALCRDVPFDEYDTNDLTRAACEDLNALDFESEFGFKVSPSTLFRGSYKGCAEGPHVSQFLLQDVGFGNQTVSQVMDFPKEGLDYMTDMPSWFKVQNGDRNLSGTDVLTVQRRMYTMRDAGQWVHIDLPAQSGLYACLILNSLVNNGAEISDAVPYGTLLTTSDAFTTLGIPDITGQAALAAGYALKHAWFQKWAVHRRLRPEVYAQRLELFNSCKLGHGNGDVFTDPEFVSVFGEGAEVWGKTVVLKYISKHNEAQNKANGRTKGGTWLLPMGYPEGSPSHPAYPGGHSCFVAAAATIAKAFFNDTQLPNPVMVNPKSPGELMPYDGPPLTVHGELNKMIANVTHFRDGAGMHWRTDGAALPQQVDVGGAKLDTGGNLIGEAVAVSMLRDVKLTYREEVGTFKFESISGKIIRV